MKTLKDAIVEFACLLTDQAGMDLLSKSGLHEEGLSDFHANGFSEDEYRESIADFALTTLAAKFQEIVAPVLQTEDQGNLVKDGNDPYDYILREGADGAWITIGSVDVYLKRENEGVVVDLYPTYEHEEPLSSAWLTFSDTEANEPERELAAVTSEFWDE